MSQEDNDPKICYSPSNHLPFIMPCLSYSSRIFQLFSFLVALAPSTLGLAVPQEDVATGAVAVDSLEVPAMPLAGNTAIGISTGNIVQPTAIAAGVPENSDTLQLSAFPIRPLFDNSTRFQDKKNYTDPDAPIVTSFKNSSNLTTYHIQDEEVFGRYYLSNGFLFRVSCTRNMSYHSQLTLKKNTMLMPRSTTGGLPLTSIPVFFSPGPRVNGSERTSAGNATAQGIDYAMPRILEQLEVSSEEVVPLVEESSPVLTEALMHLLGQSDLPVENTTTQNATSEVSEGPPLQRRWSCCKGISIKKVINTVGDIVTAIPKGVVKVGADLSCKTSTAVLLPGYIAVHADVKAQNPGPGLSVTESHMYFLFQLYGYFPLTAGLRLHFNSRKILGFIGDYDAITFGRDMFIVGDYSLNPKPGPEDKHFQVTTSIIIHEIRHCQQYRSLGWFIPAFGAKYLYQYCQAGFKYKTLKFEAEAYAQEDVMKDLLFDPYGYMFFRYWRFRKLGSKLGYPVATTYRPQSGTDEAGLYELPFQYGILLTTFYSDGACWSYLTTAEAAAREKAINCRNLSGRCEPDTTTYEKARARKKDCLKDVNLR